MPKPTPQELQQLNDEYRFRYDRLAPMDEDGSMFQALLQEQLRGEEALQQSTDEALMLDRIKTGDRTGIPQTVEFVLDKSEAIGDVPDEANPFSRFMPGFDPVVDPDRGATVNVQQQRPAPTRGELTRAESLAVVEAEKYFRDQGFPTFEEAQQQSLQAYLDEFGDQDSYINNAMRNSNISYEDALAEYDQGYNLALNPPGGFPNTADNKAKQKVLAEFRGGDAFGDIKKPVQPRRYQQYGEMPKVGPRMESPLMQTGPIKLLRDMSPEEAEASLRMALGSISPPTGGSLIAEELRRNPEIARDVPLNTLAAEAFRPQVIKSGDVVREERQLERTQRGLILEDVGAIMKEQGIDEQKAMKQYITDLEKQSYELLVAQGMKDRITPEYVRTYRIKDPMAFADSFGKTHFEVQDNIIKDMSRQAVMEKFRSAGLYDTLFYHFPDYGAGGSISRYNKIGYNIDLLAKELTEDPEGRGIITHLKEQGRIDPDAVVESTPMQYARNINVAFRAAINPAMEMLETGFDTVDELAFDDYVPAMRTGSDEIRLAEKTGQKLIAPTLDLTDDDAYVAENGYMDAFLKELLVETATGRTLGNDLVSFHPIHYYTDRMVVDPKTGEITYPSYIGFHPDTVVIGGTVAEMFIPIEAPVVMMSKAAQGVAKMPHNFRTYYKLGGLGGELKQFDTIADAAKAANKAESRDIVQNIATNSRVTQHVAEDAADIVIGLERLEDLGPKITPNNVDNFAADLSPRGVATMRAVVDAPGDNSAIATKLIDEMAANPEKAPTLSAAATDSKLARADTVQTQFGPQQTRAQARVAQANAQQASTVANTPAVDVAMEAGRRQRMRMAAADALQSEGGQFDNFHMLTDRVAVSDNFLNTFVDGQPMPLVLVDDVTRQMGGVPLKPQSEGLRTIDNKYFVLGGEPVHNITVPNASGGNNNYNYYQIFMKERQVDPHLNNILTKVEGGKEISFSEDMYLRNRMFEENAMIRGVQTNQNVPHHLARNLPVVGKFFKPPAGDIVTDLTKAASPTRDVIRTTPGSVFQKSAEVPRERRMGLFRGIGAQAKEAGGFLSDADRAITRGKVKEALGKVKQKLTGGRITEKAKSIEGGVAALDDRMAEAVVALERQTPLAASRMRKQGLTDQETIDTMMYMGASGEDFTEVMAMGKSQIQQKAITSKQNVVDAMYDALPQFPNDPNGVKLHAQPIVQDYYGRLFGPSFNLPENQMAFEIALDTIRATPDDVLSHGTISKVVDEMRKLPGATETMAIRPNMLSPFGGTTADILGAKLTMAADSARGVRMNKVAQEMAMDMNISRNVPIVQIAQNAGVSEAKAQQLLAGTTMRIVVGLDDEASALGMLEGVMGPSWVRTNITGQGKSAKGYLQTSFGQQAQLQANYVDTRVDRLVNAGVPPRVAEATIIQPFYAALNTDSALWVDDVYGGMDRALGGIKDIDGQIVSQNLSRLRRASPGAYAQVKDNLMYGLGFRKRLVQGQLGGMALPNGIYHAENFATAPLIASITAPDYIGTVIEQQLRTGLGVRPVLSTVQRGALDTGTGSVAANLTRFDDPLTGLDRFADSNGMIGRYTKAEALEHYRMANMGTTQASLQLGDNFVRDVVDIIETNPGYRGMPKAMKDGLAKGVSTGRGTSWGMQIADSTDRMFREAVFFEALKRGSTPKQASQLAREVLLDYGQMPAAAKEGIGQWFLYVSFQYMMGLETLKALAKPRNARFLIAELNRQRVMSEDIHGKQTEMLDAVMYHQIDKMYETDADAFATYYRSPMIGSFKQITGVLNYVNGVPTSPYFSDAMKEAAKEPQRPVPAGLDAVLDSMYSPLLEFLTKENMEYKKAIPDKTIFHLASLPKTGPLSGPNAMEFFDMEYVPLEEQRPGKAELGVMRVDPSTGMMRSIPELNVADQGGYQIRFKSDQGYQNFLLYQKFLNMSGYGRLLNDITGQLITMGYYPEGTTFGYSEKGSPVLYMPGRQKIIRVPKEWEKRDRQIRMQEQELRKFLEGIK